MLEVNEFNLSNHLHDKITAFKDKSCCENFHPHLKMLEISISKGNAVDSTLMSTKLDSKCTSLLMQN